MENEPIMNQRDTEIRTSTIDSEVIVERPVSHFGLIIGILIIALALVFVGIYLWIQMTATTKVAPLPKPERPTAAENNEPESTTAEAKTEVLDVVSTSHELSAIEADLSATREIDVESIFNAVDAELNAALQ